MMLKDWVLLIILVTIALCLFIVFIDHIWTEIQFQRWWRAQQNRKR